MLFRSPTTLTGFGITDAVKSSDLGSTVATLVDGKIPSTQLPSYVDEILEFPTSANFPTLGSSGFIYIDASTHASYRWSGTAYINVGQAGGSTTVNFVDVLGKPTTLDGYGILDGVNSVLIGADNGLATLGPNGKLTTSQMPAAVDQIIEVAAFTDLPETGITSVIYLVLEDNKIYRFSGSAYVEISSAGIADEA